jgi:hypothetical protein
MDLPDDCSMLGDEILKCYERAVREQKPEVAEPLLCALEELARLDSSSLPMLDQAYLLIARGVRVKV